MQKWEVVSHHADTTLLFIKLSAAKHVGVMFESAARNAFPSKFAAKWHLAACMFSVLKFKSKLPETLTESTSLYRW